MKELVSKRIVIAAAGLIVAWSATLQLSQGQQVRGPTAQYLEGTPRQNQRAFSPAVITQGGKTVWLAGQTATEDLNHKSIVGDFEAQARTVFAQLDQTLKRAGGSLRNMVTMTVFINDPRNETGSLNFAARCFRMEVPRERSHYRIQFCAPGILIEIQGVTVVAEK